jgi:predicted  nucleic acid-binding Zn-ribbon protein
MPTQSIRNVCDMMAKAIKHIEQSIKAKEHQIRSLTERLEKLKSQTNPDPIQIQEIEADRQKLEEELNNDRPQLIAFQEEFAASCGR